VSQPRSQRGITLLEVLVTLAIVAGLGSLVVGVTRQVTDAELREKTVEVAAFLRQGYSLAAQSGMHHRVYFDLEKQTFELQECPDAILLRKAEEEDSEEEKTALEKAREKIESGRQSAVDAAPELSESESPEDGVKRALALEGVRVGGSLCQTASGVNVDAEGREYKRAVDSDDVRIRRIHVQHLKDAAEDSLVSINFFPMGVAEKAVVEVSDKTGDNAMYIVVHRLTGRIETRVDDDFEPDTHMRRQATGRDVGDR